MSSRTLQNKQHLRFNFSPTVPADVDYGRSYNDKIYNAEGSSGSNLDGIPRPDKIP